MALNWFKKITKENPKFWEQYLSHFDEESEKIVPNRYVVFDCETTGLDYQKDVILSIGAIVVEDNRIIVSDYFNVYLIQEVYKKESASIHGILKDGKEEKVVEAEAIIRFLEFIGNATLVGHHVNFDLEMLHQSLDRLGVGRLKNQVMDTDAMYQKFKNIPQEQHYSLDELCTLFNIKKSDRHIASGDAFITALIFLKLKKKLQV